MLDEKDVFSIEDFKRMILDQHSDYAALPETAANWTDMYHFNEDRNEHAKMFYTVLVNSIDEIKEGTFNTPNRFMTQKNYADIFYSWKPNRVLQWEAFFKMLLDQIGDNRAFVRNDNQDVFVLNP